MEDDEYDFFAAAKRELKRLEAETERVHLRTMKLLAPEHLKLGAAICARVMPSVKCAR